MSKSVVTVCALAGALGALVLSCSGDQRSRAGTDGGPPRVGRLAAALEGPVEAVVRASGDTTLKQGTPNQCFGGDLVLRLQASGRNRAVVLVDDAALAQAVGSGTLVSAQIVLDIDSTGNNWGATGAPIGAHRLTQATGEYVATWACASDSNIYNSSADCAGATAWTMWSASTPELHPWTEPATSLVTITSGLAGTVSFDVTADVAGYLSGALVNNGWLLKKQDESDSGQIDFKSKERGGDVGPRLVLTVQPLAPPPPDGGLDAGPVATTTLAAIADSHIRQGSPNQSYGADPVLRIKASGRNRALLAFDTAAITAAASGSSLHAATLELTITRTYKNWGPDRALGVHALKQPWSESAVTWNCAIDGDVTNSDDDCSGADAWTMWGASITGVPWRDPPKATAVISSEQTGTVTFDVTRDVACYLAGHHTLGGNWIVKKELESQAGHIELASRETTTPPRLLLSFGGGTGVQVTAEDCGGTTTPPSCTPTGAIDATCDGVDDDCDGTADDDFAVVDTSCGVGACAATGERSCVDALITDTCTAGTPAAADATCDGVDDDCDAIDDDDFVASCSADALTACVAGVVQTQSCNDGDGCNGVESCVAGACAPGTPLPIDDGDPCTADACDPVAGVSHVQLAAGASCSDGNACNGAEQCSNDGWSATRTVPAHATFLRINSDSASNAVIEDLAARDFVPGDLIELRRVGAYRRGSWYTDTSADMVAVFSSSSTLLAGSVQARVPGAVASTAPAHVTAPTHFGTYPTDIPQDFFVPGTGLVVAVPAGATRLFVGVSDSYMADNTDPNGDFGIQFRRAPGTCARGTPPVVDDGNVCTTDACDPSSGVLHTVNVGAACDDGLVCTQADACDAAGTCRGAPVDVDDGDPCTLDTCVEPVGAHHTDVAEDTPCADDDHCDGEESCRTQVPTERFVRVQIPDYLKLSDHAALFTASWACVGVGVAAS